MNKERAPLRLSRPAVVIFALSSLVSGCDETSKNPEPSSIDPYTRDAVCRILASGGDSDCDGVNDTHDRWQGSDDWAFDVDQDGVADPMDFYFGNNYADDDKDGIANWADIDPKNPTITTEYIGGNVPQEEINKQREQITNTAVDHGLNNQIEALRILNAQLDRQSKDSDFDGNPDMYDTRTYLNDLYDEDRDGYSNGRDLFPYDDSNY